MTASTASDDGFTLLEVVLAVALLAFAAAITFPIFGQAPQRFFSTSEQLQAQQIGSSLFDELVSVRNWQAVPKSATAAEWKSVAETDWEWRTFEIPITDSAPSIIPGRSMHIRVEVKHKGSDNTLHSLEEVIWVGGDG